MNSWRFDPELNGGVAGRAFATLAQVFSLAGERLTAGPASEVLRVEREGRCGGFRRGALVTQEIRDTTDLARLALRRDPRLRDRRAAR